MTEEMLAQDIGPGDLVAICATGPYTYSMASNYIGFHARRSSTLKTVAIVSWPGVKASPMFCATTLNSKAMERI